MSQRAKLSALVLFLIAAVVVHLAFRSQVEQTGSLRFAWHFWLALVAGLALVGYALAIRCPAPTCRRPQVFRGWSIFDLRWPKERCYYCGSRLEDSSSGHTAP
jgi:hypothetical protein